MSGNGFTITANEFVALNGGTPWSVTIVVMVLLVPDCDKSGVHVMIPLVGLITGAFVPSTVLVSTYAREKKRRKTKRVSRRANDAELCRPA